MICIWCGTTADGADERGFCDECLDRDFPAIAAKFREIKAGMKAQNE